jgi:predicted transposase YbfD/YdcC
MGLAGVAQVVRIHRHVQHVRKGTVVKETHEVAFTVTTFGPQETGPEQLLQLAREHWSIENGQHHRRDRTQDEDRCTVSNTNAARNLSLFRSLAIFLFKRQAKGKRGKKSLPDFQSRNHSHPWSLIRRFTDQQQE